jgi:hypothetical protein
MTLDDSEHDPTAGMLASLKTYDVSSRHADRLRTRCHAQLQAQTRKHAPFGTVNGTALRRFIGPAVGGAWCVAYLLEIIRRVGAIYGF